MTPRVTLLLVGAAATALVISLADLSSPPASAEVTTVAPDDAQPQRERDVRFNRDVRPILSDACFSCHGFDQNTREADLRLDAEQHIFADRGGYAAIVPGEPLESEVYLRITEPDARDQMPPAHLNRQLEEQEIETIRRWIEQGAQWEDHWSFVAPSEPAVPPAPPEHADWPRNPIDHFVLAELAEEGLSPSEEADRRTLIRRLSFDLTGLPPAPEEVDRFLNDDRPDAYERLVDRLLASPHYGERMAIYWLDLVRYADTVGYHGDQLVTVWPYRDYVIQAFNDNLPFDQFTREQLAGDLLPEPTQDQRVAAAYNRLGMMSGEGGGQDGEYLARYAADRVRNASAVWMGTTLGCAECHDHKYDPFSIEDFYEFAAFFADIEQMGIYHGGRWGEKMSVPSDQQKTELDRLETAIAEATAQLHRDTPELRDARREWEASLDHRWHIVEPASLEDRHGATLAVQDDGAILASGDASDGRGDYRLAIPLDADALGPITAIQLEVLPHDSLPSNGPGRAGNGNFVLSDFVVELERNGQRTPIALTNATATHAQDTGNGPHFPDVSITADTPQNHGWAILPQAGQANTAVFETAEDLTLAADEEAVLHVRMHQRYGSNHTIGRFRLAVTDRQRPVRAADGSPEIAEILEIPADDRTAEQRAKLDENFRATTPALADERRALADLEAQRDALHEQIPRMVATVARDEPRETRVLPAGDWTNDSGQVVQPAVPHFLRQIDTEENQRATRLDLAEWLVADDNPLTSRTFVNRLWAMYFNNGISGTLDDLGSQGEWPSHPDMLDWLAIQFVESGWDVKDTIRLIVTSSTYRQSSRSDSRLDDVDPLNRLLARQSRFRVQAEIVRDNALKISGLLESEIGGPSVFPYQPEGYWAMLNFPTRTYQQDTGSALYRRGLYNHWQRQYLHPGLMAFDAPSREECTAERAQSNTPLQALVLLNDPIFVEAARSFAERILLEADGDDLDQQIDLAFRHAISREAADDERQLIRTLYQEHRDQYEAAPEEAAALLEVGEKRPHPDLDPVEIAAWTSVARVLLNLHETITRY